MMLRIEDTLISEDIIGKKFCCIPENCLGACCVKGDSGAPLLEEEISFLEQSIHSIKLFLSEKGLQAIEEQGVSVIDDDKDIVTPLIDGEECAYTVFENGIARCAIEKAFNTGAIPFRKPVSCHLYPVRIGKSLLYTTLNYDQWDICETARKAGEEKQIPVFEFVKEALIRRFGAEWYSRLMKISTGNIDG